MAGAAGLLYLGALEWQRGAKGGDKKAHDKGESDSRTGGKQNAGHGARNVHGGG